MRFSGALLVAMLGSHGSAALAQPAPAAPEHAAAGAGPCERLVLLDLQLYPGRDALLAQLRSEARGRRDPAASHALVDSLTALATAAGAELQRALEPLGGVTLRTWWLVPAALVRVPEPVLPALAGLPIVRRVDVNHTHHATVRDATDAAHHDADWVQQSLGLFGDGGTLAVLDSGIDVSVAGSGVAHPVFDARTWNPLQPRSRIVKAVDARRPPVQNPNADDQDGHGTSVAAIAAGRRFTPASSDDGFAPGARIASYRITTNGTSTTTADVIEAYNTYVARDAVPLGIRAANHSYSGSPDPNDLAQLAADAIGAFADVLVVTSAGNWNPQTMSGPTIYSQSNLNGLAVGSIAKFTKTVAPSSSFGPLPGDGARWFPDLVAVGELVLSARCDDTQGMALVSGTSFAAPMVAGTAVLLRAARPGLSVLDAKVLLLNQVEDLTAQNPQKSRMHYGLGMLRTDLAVDAALQSAPWRGVVTSQQPLAVFPVTVPAGRSHAATLGWERRDYRGSTPYFVDLDNLDLRVRDPGGRQVALSNSLRNLYERVVFVPLVAGTYTLEVDARRIAPGLFGGDRVEFALAFGENHGGGKQAGSFVRQGQGCAGTAPAPAGGTIMPESVRLAWGDTRSELPFAWYPTRCQQAVPHSFFAGPLTVAHLAFRRDENMADSPPFSANLELDFGYTAAHPHALSTIFSKNPIPGSMTRVLASTALRFPGTQGLPKSRDQFDFVIPLDQPFTIQTDRFSHFLWETRLYAHTGGGSNAPFGCWFDAQRDPRASRVYSVGLVSRPDGLRDDAMIVTSLLGPGGGTIAPDLQAAGVPQLGQSFDLVLRHAPPRAPVALCHGSSSSHWGGVPLPFDLAALGAPGCLVLTDWSFAIPFTAGAGGQLELSCRLPSDPILVSSTFFSQFAVLDPAANLLGITVSNAGEAIVGG